MLGLGNARGGEVKVAPTDPVAYLHRGFPDVTKQLSWLETQTGAQTARELLESVNYRWGVEFFTMDLCLAKPVYRWRCTCMRRGAARCGAVWCSAARA